MLGPGFQPPDLPFPCALYLLGKAPGTQGPTDHFAMGCQLDARVSCHSTLGCGTPQALQPGELSHTETGQVRNRDTQRDGGCRRSLGQTAASPPELISPKVGMSQWTSVSWRATCPHLSMARSQRAGSHPSCCLENWPCRSL